MAKLETKKSLLEIPHTAPVNIDVTVGAHYLVAGGFTMPLPHHMNFPFQL